MIPAIQEIGFGPGTAKPYATLHQATCSFAEMGDRTISTQVRIDGDVVPDFSGWELLFKGERFVLPVREPQAAKDNTTRNSLVDLTFYSWPTLQMKRYFFFNLPSVTAGVAIPDQYVASVNLPITSFVQLFNGVLRYYFGSTIRMDLFSQEYDQTPVQVEINYSHIWDVLTKLYDIYGYRWRIVEESGVYVIKVNYPDERIEDHDFEYGYQGGLLKFERQVQDDNINNVLLGRGGEKNLPYRYFKRYTGSGERPDTFPDDTDALYELKDIYFDRLRDANFRWYVRGWMQNSNRDRTWENAGYTYPQYTENDCPEENLFAFRKGKTTDTSFQPVEYVKDDNSIEKYGEHWGAVENNDNIYPTIQGISRDGIGRIDETVAVSDITTDDVDAAAENAATENIIEGRKSVSGWLYGGDEVTGEFIGEIFEIPEGKTGNLAFTANDGEDPYFVSLSTGYSPDVYASIRVSGYRLRAQNVDTGDIVPGAGIPAGTYRYVAEITVENDNLADVYGTYGFNGIKLVLSDEDTDAWKPTFDIWVKNIWNTQRAQGESDQEYSERVWLPILGDRVGNEAKLVFSTGPMSISQDYEFQIAAYPVPDQTKSLNGVPSEWKITLRKSEAEFDATGLFIPNATQGGRPEAGDKFFFTGIDMPGMYVTEAEKRLNEVKTSELDKSAEVNPTWAITLDKIRVHTLEDGEYGKTLAERLSAGCTVRTTDPRFTPGTVLVLYVRSLTYTWNEGDQVPNIEVVLSDKVVSSGSVLQKLSGEIDYVRESYLKASDLDAAVRRVATPLFLKKTGEADVSYSPTTFSSVLRSKNFRQGDIGGAGWGHYEDGDGDSVLELDKLVVRKEMRVNSLVVNQISYMGGKQIISAAAIECTQVIEDSFGYKCYFDQKQGSVSNHFVVGDIAYGQTFDPDNTQVRYYRCTVSAVGPDYIYLVKAGKGGTGAPQKGDTIVQYGNTSDTSRQYVIVRDVIGGGYERMLSGLSGTRSAGTEYYFAGRKNGESPRWFVGSNAANGNYAEWANGVFTVKGNIIVTGGNLQYLMSAIGENEGAQGGVILSQFMGVRDADNHIVAGMNGSHTLTGWTKSGYGILMIAAGIPTGMVGQAADKATTRIFSSGDVFCSKLHADGGKIGPFNINYGSTSADNLYAIDEGDPALRYLSLEPGKIALTIYPASGGNSYLVAQFGIEQSQVQSNSLTAAIIKNNRTSTIAGAARTNFGLDVEVNANSGMTNTGIKVYTAGSGTNTGIDVEASAYYSSSVNNYAGKFNANGGGTNNYGLYVSASGGTNNYAIYCEKGSFAGLRPKLRHITNNSAVTLDGSDYNVILHFDGNANIWIPSSANEQEGMTFFIYQTYNQWYRIHIPSGTTLWQKSNSYTSYFDAPSGCGFAVLYRESSKKWQISIHYDD